MTADDAEVAKEEQNAQSLDEDSLGQLEEDIKALGLMLRQGNPSQVGELERVCDMWRLIVWCSFLECLAQE